ncbi:CARDB domain-containing protein [Aeoliella mucimassa]|uniref:Large cysteine-rich periplasmic protein OmcB n=1 Tax=Aeoliella mucimassa TaxID=2527972 RepID=A0A518AN70_9BACT|nr:CARDB domain-containing protein [Aeoliella mucimassa]QDU56177.1 Large cysteine-rich periplasmic protein OmcB precursor [Aeoliella mucimassa]
MHRPTEIIRSILCTFVIVSTLSSASNVLAEDGPSLSDRLSQLRRSWTGEQPPAAEPAPQPQQQAGGRDLFDVLRGKPEQPAARVASVPAPSRQRAGSVLSKPQQSAVYDIGPALGGAPLRTQAKPVKVATRPETTATRHHSGNDIALDLIGTSADSNDTSGVSTTPEPVAKKEPVVSEPVAPKVDEAPLAEVPVAEEQTEEPEESGFASADEAAELALNPIELAPIAPLAPTTEPLSPSTETVAVPVVEESEAQAETEPSESPEHLALNAPTPQVVGSAQDEIDIDEFDAEATLNEWSQAAPAPPVVAPVEQEADSNFPPIVDNGMAPNSADAEQAFTAAPPAASNLNQQPWSTTPLGVNTQTPAGLDNENVLVNEQLPLIASRVAGPKTILIGREATYRVTLENRGTAAANQLSTEVVAPEWADVIHTTASAGTVQREASANGGTTLRWDVASLAEGRSQTLNVVLVPKTSQSLSLGVSWRHAPVATTTMVEVQEPKIEMAINGPNEVYFGRPQSYHLSLSNPGTGPAENIVVQLMPPGGGQPTSSYRIDQLAAGESKSVDIEITAREPGELAIRAMAVADGNLRCETAQSIFCRHAELNVDWRGPNRKYAGTEAVYYFRVRNPGTASADQTQFVVSLPAGFEFRSASEGHQFDSAAQRVIWNVGTLRPGDDRYLELRGVVNQAGANQFNLSASNGAGDVRDSVTASTDVVALADLKLDIVDPKGPVPVGTEIEYAITVTNRGRSAAEQVNIVGLFAQGIEPVAALGAEATIADGRVGFRSIGSLPAGQQVTLKIRARAQAAGTHLFRAEVLCRDLEIKLAAEETTRFFQDDSQPANTPLESASRASRFE